MRSRNAKTLLAVESPMAEMVPPIELDLDPDEVARLVALAREQGAADGDDAAPAPPS